MKEDFLHFLWRSRRFDARHLHTTDGQPVEILHPGELNTHAGPDFFNSRLRLGDTEWAGTVEMHLRASDWYGHAHQRDPAYDNVILHVVWEADREVLRPSGTTLPCLCLQPYVDPALLATYQWLLQDEAWIPCAARFAEAPGIVRLNWLDRLLVERLEEKTSHLATHLEATNGHWEEAFYRDLTRAFGLKINADPFEALARSLPLNVLARHKTELFQIEALLFGQAGLLGDDFKDDYPRALAKEYRYLRHKYSLEPLAPGQMKFLRLRPANFPSVRLAQLAALIHHSSHLFSKILETSTLRQLENLFSVQTSVYWLNHYQFDRLSLPKHKWIGRDFVHALLTNSVVPSLFHYGRWRQQPEYQDKALRLLDDLPAESNTLLDGWATLGATARSAYQAQALIQLKTRYCDRRRCLECAIGNALLR